MTLVLTTVADARRWVRSQQASGKTVGFAPTMGALHGGHLSLMRRARQRCGASIASIFVNPLQFGPSEDFDRYPRDFARDLAMIESERVDAVFHPEVKEMYPAPTLTFVDLPGLSDTLCGASRPGHFRGVATVVAKLFQIVPADVAFFGQKDAQQVAVIRRMVRDLNIPIQIEACPIVREADGLAMSSRNIYLNADQRKNATALYRSLQQAAEMVKSGIRQASAVESAMRQTIESTPGAEIDYAKVVDFDTLQPLSSIAGSMLIAVAVRFGKTRLIDNIVVELEKQVN
jgi:pantoate--beta-alanine ligase